MVRTIYVVFTNIRLSDPQVRNMKQYKFLCPFSKEDINEIKRLYNVEHLSQYKIAERYNVSRGNIQQILNGSIYKDRRLVCVYRSPFVMSP